MSTENEARGNAEALFAGPGEVRALARELDWSQTILGPTVNWSPALRTTARAMFDSPFPTCLWAGPSYALIYNDAYRRILNAKHPASLGRPGSVVWAEIWEELQPQFEGVRAGGEPLYFHDAPFVMARLEGGATETAYFDYSLSALRDEDGSVAAVLNITPETTGRLVIQRRLVAEQEALATSEGRLRLAVENADVGFWDVDAVSGELTWPTRTKAMFGMSADAPVTMDDFYGGLHPGDREATVAAYLAAADPDRRAIYDVEYRTIGKEDGVERWAAAKGRGVFDGSGQCLRVTGTALDITARKTAEIRRNAIADLTQAIRDLREPADIVYAAAEVLGRALGSARVGYAAIDHDAETLHVDRDWTAPGVETLAGVLSFRDYGSFVDSLKRGEFTVIEDVSDDPRTAGPAADALASKHTRAFVNAPVLEQDRLVAVFFVNHEHPRVWTEGDLKVIREFAERTRSAVERARGEHALRDSEARLRELNETLERRIEEQIQQRNQLWRLSRSPFVVCDTQGVWISASPVWTDILGWSQEDLIGRTSEWMEHPDDNAKTRGKVVDVSGGEVMTEFVNRFRGKDGQYRWFSWTATAEDGRLFCVARDVTHETRQAEALRLYEDIVQSDTAPICAFDTEYRLTAFNRAHSDEFFRIYGYRVKVGDVFPDLFSPEQAPIMQGFMARALTGEVFTVTQEFGDPNLVVPYWEVAYNPLRAADGRIVGAFHHAIDISVRLRAQADLSVTQEALRQSQKMEAVGQLTGGLAHDFNNLLAGISGSLEMMQARIDQGRLAEIERYMTGAQGAAKRAAALTHRLLAFSRRQTLAPKPTDVNRLVGGMQELIRRTVGPEVTVDTVTAFDVWPALVDPNQLENALLNLALNARDAMPGGGAITIQTANRWIDEKEAEGSELTPGAYLSLTVADNGTGMPKEVADRAFDPFYTTKPIGVGTGLGLSMIHGFARQSGGQVSIRSEVGRGTEVRIDLPRHHVEEAVEGLAAVEPIARTEGARTILVVDDEPLVRMLVVDAVEELGHTALEVGDGPQALKVLRSDVHLDLLITDVGLPNGMNGRQVADAARELRPELNVLFITGYAENAVLSGGVLDRGMEVVTKPFDLKVLAGRIQALVKSERL